jgi:Domain of unknown function (DUF1844)
VGKSKMAEREETSFKVTDRRKYNPDGSPREGAETDAEPIPVTAEPQPPIQESTANNVVLFPGEANKQPEQVPQTEPVPRESRTAAPAPAPTPAQAAAGRAEQAYNQARGPESPRLPEASFLSLSNMLAVEAAMHLGLIQSQGEEAPQVDLESARHLIDMLGILQAKTRGNLTGEEENLLENVLADLRMQFVAISKRR